MMLNANELGRLGAKLIALDKKSKDFNVLVTSAVPVVEEYLAENANRIKAYKELITHLREQDNLSERLKYLIDLTD